MQKIRCPSCGQKYYCRPSKKGKPFHCTKCGASFMPSQPLPSADEVLTNLPQPEFFSNAPDARVAGKHTTWLVLGACLFAILVISVVAAGIFLFCAPNWEAKNKARIDELQTQAARLVSERRLEDGLAKYEELLTLARQRQNPSESLSVIIKKAEYQRNVLVAEIEKRDSVITKLQEVLEVIEDSRKFGRKTQCREFAEEARKLVAESGVRDRKVDDLIARIEMVAKEVAGTPDVASQPAQPASRQTVASAPVVSQTTDVAGSQPTVEASQPVAAVSQPVISDPANPQTELDKKLARLSDKVSTQKKIPWLMTFTVVSLVSSSDGNIYEVTCQDSQHAAIRSANNYQIQETAKELVIYIQSANIPLKSGLTLKFDLYDGVETGYTKEELEKKEANADADVRACTRDVYDFIRMRADARTEHETLLAVIMDQISNYRYGVKRQPPDSYGACSLKNESDELQTPLACAAIVRLLTSGKTTRSKLTDFVVRVATEDIATKPDIDLLFQAIGKSSPMGAMYLQELGYDDRLPTNVRNSALTVADQARRERKKAEANRISGNTPAENSNPRDTAQTTEKTKGDDATVKQCQAWLKLAVLSITNQQYDMAESYYRKIVIALPNSEEGKKAQVGLDELAKRKAATRPGYRDVASQPADQ